VNIIIAPHCDDEVIGTYEVLKNKNDIAVVYSMCNDDKRMKHARKLQKFFSSIKVQVRSNSIPDYFLNREHTFYAPDPSTEVHPLHREWGFRLEQMARNSYNVVFYTTLMNTPYIHEVVSWQHKKYILNRVYPDQKDLWRFDHKYFLFEGYTQWIFPKEAKGEGK